MLCSCFREDKHSPGGVIMTDTSLLPSVGSQALALALYPSLACINYSVSTALPVDSEAQGNV